MLVRILLFARLREICGADEVEIELADGGTLANARAILESKWPELGGLLPYSRFAVDNRYVPDATSVKPEQEIALIPPVSGG